MLFNKNLNKYEEIVSLIEKGSIPVDNELKRIQIPNDFKNIAYAILAEKDTNNEITIEILVGSAFPQKHIGYLYKSNGIIEEDSFIDKRWPRKRKINKNWFAISD